MFANVSNPCRGTPPPPHDAGSDNDEDEPSIGVADDVQMSVPFFSFPLWSYLLNLSDLRRETPLPAPHTDGSDEDEDSPSGSAAGNVQESVHFLLILFLSYSLNLSDLRRGLPLPQATQAHGSDNVEDEPAGSAVDDAEV